MKSSAFLHVFNNISPMHMYLQNISKHSLGNLSIEFHVSYEILLRIQWFSCCSDKYTEISMYDLELFYKIRSHF